MAHTHTINSVETVYDQASNDYIIAVGIEVFEDGVSKGNRSFGYQTDTTTEAIQEDLAKVCATLDSDKETAARSANLEARLANAELIKESLMSK